MASDEDKIDMYATQRVMQREVQDLRFSVRLFQIDVMFIQIAAGVALFMSVWNAYQRKIDHPVDPKTEVRQESSQDQPNHLETTAKITAVPIVMNNHQYDRLLPDLLPILYCFRPYPATFVFLGRQ